MSITGCKFTVTDRLEPAIALTSVTVLTFLNLHHSRNEEIKDLPSADYIDKEYVRSFLRGDTANFAPTGP